MPLQEQVAEAAMLATGHAPRSEAVVRIAPSRGWISLKLADLWEYRELLYFLTWRDIKVRYKQTVLGAAWAVLQPLATMAIFSLFFGRLAKMPSDGIPYPVFTFSALVPWTFFSVGLSRASDSLVGSSHLIKKVYFPRLAIPIAKILSSLVDFALAFAILLVFLPFYGVKPSIYSFWLVPFTLLSLMAAMGVSFWLSAMNVQFRDVQYIIPFLTQLWFFATPVVYPSSLMREPWRTIYGLNPMVGVVEGFRWALLGKSAPPVAMLVISAAVSVLLLVSGAFYFRRMEKTFADVV
jgi:lipopolysaccharide transport system permease protein